MVVVLFVDLVEDCGDDLGSFSDVAFDSSVIAEARGDGFCYGQGELQGVKLICFPGCLGVGQGLGPFFDVGGLLGGTSWAGGGVASLTVGALPGFFAAVCGPVAISTLSAGVFAVSGWVSELLTLVTLDGFLLGSVFLAVVPYTFEWEAMHALAGGPSRLHCWWLS